MVKVGVVFFLLNNFNLLRHVLRVRVAVKVAIGRSAEPVVACLELIVEIFIVVSFGLLFHIGVSIGAFAPQWESTSSMLISRLNILVISSIAWELGRIGGQLRSRSIAVQQILWMRPLELIPCIARESSAIDGIDVQMGTLQLIILLVVVDLVWNQLLLDETSLVDCILGEVGLDYFKLAVMPSAFAIRAQAILVVVVAEVGFMEFAGCFGEDVFLLHAVVMVVPEIVGATGGRIQRGIEAVGLGSL